MTSEIRSFPDCSCNTTMGHKTAPSSTNTPLIAKIFSFSKSVHLDLSNDVKSKKRWRGTLNIFTWKGWNAKFNAPISIFVDVGVDASCLFSGPLKRNKETWICSYCNVFTNSKECIANDHVGNGYLNIFTWKGWNAKFNAPVSIFVDVGADARCLFSSPLNRNKKIWICSYCNVFTNSKERYCKWPCRKLLFKHIYLKGLKCQIQCTSFNIRWRGCRCKLPIFGSLK